MRLGPGMLLVAGLLSFEILSKDHNWSVSMQ